MPLAVNRLQGIASGATTEAIAFAVSKPNLCQPNTIPPPAPGHANNPWTKGRAWQGSTLRKGNTYAPLTLMSQYKPAVDRAPSAYVPSRAPAAVPVLQTSLGQNDPQVNAQFYDPSAAPNPSLVTTNWDQRGPKRSNASRSSFRKPVNTAACKLSSRSRDTFHLGDILTVPYHTANTNPKADFSDPCLTSTLIGPVYSKRRMFVVLAKFQKHMECLPLYTHNGRGIKHKSMDERKEYVAVMNVGEEKTFVNDGTHAAVAVSCRKKPILPHTFIHVVESVAVACEGHVTQIGKMEKGSFQDLKVLWLDMATQGQSEAWIE